MLSGLSVVVMVAVVQSVHGGGPQRDVDGGGCVDGVSHGLLQSMVGISGVSFKSTSSPTDLT